MTTAILHLGRKSTFAAALTVLVLTGCASATVTGRAPEVHINGTYDRPQKIVVNLVADPQHWREDWRSAFGQQGYEVIFQDEIGVAGVKPPPSTSIDKPRTSDAATAPGEFDLSYHAVWDIIWYVHTVDLTVRDPHTGAVLANYSEGNYWAHPDVNSVAEKIERDCLSKLWKTR